LSLPLTGWELALWPVDVLDTDPAEVIELTLVELPTVGVADGEATNDPPGRARSVDPQGPGPVAMRN
jgi:hypothetical protein